MTPTHCALRGLALAVLFAAGPAAYATCEAGPGVLRGQTAKVALAFRTTPPVIKVGELFSLQAEICPQEGISVTGLKVDAGMPAHKHGMNYRPRVSGTGPGKYTATGLMFHMPGQWQLAFDVETSVGRERIRVDYTAQ